MLYATTAAGLLTLSSSLKTLKVSRRSFLKTSAACTLFFTPITYLATKMFLPVLVHDSDPHEKKAIEYALQHPTPNEQMDNLFKIKPRLPRVHLGGGLA